MDNKVQILKVGKRLSDFKAEKLKGKFIDVNYCKQLINYDCDVYDMYNNLLIRFRKNIIPLDILKLGYDSFKNSIELTDGRGIASGSSHKRIRKDGSISNITIGDKVHSGNVGYMDANAMIHYCRKTAFARDYFEKFTAGIPFVEYIDKLYEQFIPGPYKKQKSVANSTNRNYTISNTAFTTVTVNKNFQTAVHKDSGDYLKGFGNVIIYNNNSYTGGYTVMPQYGIDVDCQNGDVCFMDVHQWHANTPIIPKKEKELLRISFVLYYREKMIKCKQPAEELKRIKIAEGGYLRYTKP